MQYLGGKTRIAKQLATVINKTRGTLCVWDAFCGGLSVTAALGGEVFSSDGNEALIATYRAVASGWDPPSVVTEDDYAAARGLPNSDPRKAFVAIGCSFGGKWFGGYARCRDPNDKRSTAGYAVGARRHLQANCPGREFFYIDFLRVVPRPMPAILYLDPPYKGTTGYAGTGDFDHEAFYSRVAAWSQHVSVYVSEYNMPSELGGTVVWEREVNTSLSRGKNGRGVERLYSYGGGA